MLERLLDILACPACLPEEHQLSIRVDHATGEDILEGELRCRACGAAYPIRQGLAELLPPDSPVPPVQARYDQKRVVASYLWSHFADLWGDPQATGAYCRWAEMAPVRDANRKNDAGSDQGIGLDAGCSVGRFTLELAARTGFAVGVDLSRSFTSLARTLAREGRTTFEAPREGLLLERFTIELPERLRANPVEFITADAQALPFRRSCFAVTASLNIVDKIPRPLDHLRECQRVCAAPSGFLVSDPFSWSPEVAQPAAWLGGTEEAGPALENVVRLLGQEPGWRARLGEPVWWTIRDHANRYELIRSQSVLAERES
jgi:uncharacterized protein YbaR (Trm112 family)